MTLLLPFFKAWDWAGFVPGKGPLVATGFNLLLPDLGRISFRGWQQFVFQRQDNSFEGLFQVQMSLLFQILNATLSFLGHFPRAKYLIHFLISKYL
jgi:hypothetical protein